MADLMTLQKALGMTFKNPALLEQALVHSSCLNENPDCAPTSNERLEFLGDAVLGLVVAQKLYQKFPDYDEGEMTKLRAALVRKETLARVAKDIGLGEYLLLGKGEEISGGRDKPSNLASGLEAVIAAIFLDRGFAPARNVILKLLRGELRITVKKGTVIDYKSQLQELIQAKMQQTPVYHIRRQVGPAQNRTFIAEVRAGDKLLGVGSGKSKKIAESEAARSALK